MIKIKIKIKDKGNKNGKRFSRFADI